MRRTVVTVAAVAVMGAALSACSDKVAGSPATDVGSADTVSVERGDTPITPAALSTVTCAPLPNSIALPFCDTAPVAARDVPSGARIALRAGDPIRFIGGAVTNAVPNGQDRICTVAGFVTDGANTYALSGNQCAVTKADPTTQGWKPAVGASASTVDGYKLGEVSNILYSRTAAADGPGGFWRVPVVKLASNVAVQANISGTTSPSVGASVNVRGAASGDIDGYSALPDRGLTWSGTGTKPVVAAGDQGAAVVQGGKLLGLISGQSTMAMPVVPTADKLITSLSIISPNAKVLTK